MLLCLLAAFPALAQQPPGNPEPLVESGQVVLGGRSFSYRIRHLPVNSFPDLPAVIAEQLDQRRCLIPQTYAAHHPENVVHASLEKPGSSDWAVLCSAQGKVSLLVFFASSPADPIVLASVPETDRLQSHDSSGVLGFNWAIDPASPETVHQAQSGLVRKPPRPDHDALADSTVDGQTFYRYYARHGWTTLDTED